MQKIVISWRDIPSQVIVMEGRKRAKVLLSPRFQQAVDRAAMRARKRSEEAYLNEWRRSRSDHVEPDPVPGDLQTVLQIVAGRIAGDLEASYSDARLSALIRNHGRAGE